MASPIRPGSAPVTPPRPTGKNITVLGDSVTVAGAPALLARWHGIEIDAQVGAQLWDAPAQIAHLRAENELRPYVVVALGTNGDVADGVLASVVRAAGPGHWFVFVTAHGARSWIPPVDRRIRAFAASTHDVALADWDAAAPQVRDFADDGIHPGPQGGAVFAATIAQALDRLAARR
ncbi:MAG TPA: hypothetical protein VN088_07960 [Nocardioides sp.]|nr:hypothetical protein [Nocardioides sp.]